MAENQPTSERKAIYQFTRGLDKKLRDVMVFSYDAMVKDYIKLVERNYSGIGSKKMNIESIKLIIAVSIFYRIVLKPLYGGKSFIERLSEKYSVGIRLGNKGQMNIDTEGIANMETAFYAISKSFGVDPMFFDFQESIDLVKRLTVVSAEQE